MIIVPYLEVVWCTLFQSYTSVVYTILVSYFVTFIYYYRSAQLPLKIYNHPESPITLAAGTIPGEN